MRRWDTFPLWRATEVWIGIAAKSPVYVILPVWTEEPRPGKLALKEQEVIKKVIKHQFFNNKLSDEENRHNWGYIITVGFFLSTLKADVMLSNKTTASYSVFDV